MRLCEREGAMFEVRLGRLMLFRLLHFRVAAFAIRFLVIVAFSQDFFVFETSGQESLPPEVFEAKVATLASDIAEGEYVLKKRFEFPYANKIIEEKDAFFSCHCVRIDSSQKSEEGKWRIVGDEILLQIDFTKVPRSTHQKVAIRRLPRSVIYDWRIVVIKDVDVTPAIVRLEESTNEFSLRARITSRVDEHQKQEPIVNVPPGSVFRVSDVRQIEQREIEGGFRELEYEIQFKRTDSDRVQRSFEVNLLHPRAEIVGDASPLRPHLQMRVPIVVGKQKVRSVSVNFGVVRVGESRERQVSVESFRADKIEELIARFPDVLDARISGDGANVIITFRPKSSMRFSDELDYARNDGSIGSVKFKGFSIDENR